MTDNWDLKKSEELCKAMQECQSLEALNDIAHGIGLLPASVLSEERKAWLRTIYSTKKTEFTEAPYNTDHLTKKGKKIEEAT